MKKIYLVLGLVFLVLILLPCSVSASQAIFTVGNDFYYLDSVKYPMDATPYISEGRVFVPLRYMALASGIRPGNILFDAASQTVKIKRDNGSEIQLRLGEKSIIVDGQASEMDVYPEISNGRVCLPMRYVAQALGESVDWDAQSKTVIINTPIDYKNMAESEYKNEHYGAVVENCNKWLEISPNDTEVYMFLARAQFRLKQFDECIKTCQEIVKNAPNDEAYYISAQCRYRLYRDKRIGSKEDVLKDMQSAIDVSSVPKVLYLSRGALYLKFNQYDNAISDADKVISLAPDSTQAYYLRACAIYEKGGKTPFQEECKKILERFPDDTWAKSGLNMMNKNFYFKYPEWE